MVDLSKLSKTGELLFCSFLLLIVNTIFGGYSVVTSVVLKHSTMNPAVYAFLRDVFGSLMLLAGAWVYENRQPAPKFFIDRADTGHFILLGLFMVWGAQGMSALAIANLTPVFFSMAEPAMPVVALGAAWLLRQEPFRPREWTTWGKVAGVAVTIAGAVAMVAFSSSSANSNVRQQSKNFGLGLLYLFLQVVLGGLFSPTQKPLLNRYSSITTAAWGYTFGTGLLMLCVLTSAMEPADWDITPLSVAGIAYASVLSSATAYGLMAYVNKRTNPALIATFMPLQSVVAAFLAWVFLGETLETSTYAGGAVVCAGLLVVVWCRYVESKHAAAAEGEEGAGGKLLGGGDGEDSDGDASLLEGWAPDRGQGGAAPRGRSLLKEFERL